jgi:hypothetical protein
LKLETEKTRYWVVARCAGKVIPGWEEGVVFAEDVQPDENGKCSIVPYNPSTVKKLQRFDYLLMLRADLNHLFDEPWSWERETHRGGPGRNARADGTYRTCGPPIKSYTIITTDANDVVRPLHDRMPVILDPHDYAPLAGSHEQRPGVLQETLRPCPLSR